MRPGYLGACERSEPCASQAQLHGHCKHSPPACSQERSSTLQPSKLRLGEGKQPVNVTYQVNGRIGLEPRTAGSSDPSCFLPGSFHQHQVFCSCPFFRRVLRLFPDLFPLLFAPKSLISTPMALPLFPWFLSVSRGLDTWPL